MRHYEDLLVWRKSQALFIDVTKATLGLPSHLQGGLGEQLRRSALSIPSNIAEGCVGSQRVFARHLQIALGSASELESQLRGCGDLPFADPRDMRALTERATELKRMLTSLLRTVRTATRRR
ncbi:MAG: four helix bundle protein [Planctomycetota bacterium]|jgi:four helix bundle protein